jgi:FkbM family methyltransferase
MLKRLANRARLAFKFSSHGLRIRDQLLLFVAGVARGGPFGNASFKGRLLNKLFPSVTTRVKDIGGQRVKLVLSDFVDTMIFEELVIDGIYPMHDVPFEPDLVIDAGACRGLFTLSVASLFPKAKLVCIEPEPYNFRRLQEHLQINGIKAETYQSVVGTTVDSVIFAGDGFGGAVVDDQVSGHGTIVPSMRLDQFISNADPKRLLLKMDIEGSEETVLPQILDFLPASTTLFLETHRTNCDSFLQAYRDRGFRESVIRRRRGETPEIEYVEWCFVRESH